MPWNDEFACFTDRAHRQVGFGIQPHPTPLGRYGVSRERALRVADAPGTRGTPLSPSIRRFFESRLGCDLRDVRLHSDERAAESARLLDARAYTVGHHIVFGRNQRDVDTPEGVWLLAHELVHVIQQSGRGASAEPRSATSAERQADWVADLIARGESLPPGVAIGSVQAGIIQRHQGAGCPGYPVKPMDRSIWKPANDVIEAAYASDPNNQGHAQAVLYGSQFEHGEIRLPRGAPNKAFGNLLLAKLRGLQNQRRPDIVDFASRLFYEIKPVNYEREGTVQLESYYRITEEIRRTHAADNEPPWKVEYATWYPPHVMPLPGAVLEKIVCTQATDHTRWPGLILYDVRLLGRPRRRRKVMEHQIVDFDQKFVELLPRIRNELLVKVPEFDPEAPEYIIIVPQRFYWEWNKQKTEELIDKMRVKPPFLDTRQPIGQFHTIGWTIIGIAAAAYAVAIIAVAASAFAGGVAAAGGGAAAGGTGAGGAEVVSLAAYRAMMATPAAKELAAAAGVLIVLGSVTEVHGDTASIGEVSAMRVVSVTDFHLRGVTQAAGSQPGRREGVEVCQETAGKFELEQIVLFDSRPHYIVGKVVIR